MNKTFGLAWYSVTVSILGKKMVFTGLLSKISIEPKSLFS